jgi:PAS domain S-box-containing protein
MTPTILSGQYDWRLVALSIAIAICASYTAFDLAGRTASSRGFSRTLWWIGGSIALGLGIWAVQYVGMLAFRLPLTVFYNIPIVAFSLLAAIASSAVVLFVVSRKELSKGYLLGGSFAIGAGVAGMHYTGMLAMQMAAHPVYKVRLVALSLIAAVLVSDVALRLIFRLRYPGKNHPWIRPTAAALMGLAIASIHYIAIAAISFEQSQLTAAGSNSLSVSNLGITGIAVLTLAVLALALLGSLADRNFSLQRQMLHSEQERWQVLMEANHDGLFDANLLSGKVFYSPRWKAMLGYGPEELDSCMETWRQRIHPEDRQRVDSNLDCYLGNREGALEIEYRLRHRDGSWRWILARKQAVWDRDGRPVRLVGSHSDFTVRKQAEEKLRASENRYRELFEQNPLPSWIYRIQDLRILDVNQAAINHYGWTRDEFLGLSVASIRIPEEVDAIEAYLHESAVTNPPKKPWRHRRSHKSTIWVELSGQEIEAFGCPARVIMANDVTAHVEAETQIQRENEKMEGLVGQRTAELQKSDAKWRVLVEALPQLVWTATPDGLVDYMSSQWADYTGAATTALLGRGWLQTVHADDHLRVGAAIRTALEVGASLEFETRIRAQDGRYRWFTTRGRPLRATEGGPIAQWLGTCTDIDDQKRGEERLEAAVTERTVALAEALDRAECAARAKSEFLAVMSHEIRTPMNGVIGIAHLLADTPLTAEQHHFLDMISSSGQALLAIVNDILDFSKIEAGVMKLENVEFDLKTVLEESLELVALTAAAKDLRLSLELVETVPFNLVGDVGRLRQILLNILSNAVKFTAQGSVSVSVWREPAPDKVVMLRFSVRDTGIGLSPEQQGGLFQAFTQADSSTTRRFGGAGLGLGIAKRLVELMGGTIGVSSQLGTGSTFWFNVCLMPATATPPQFRGGRPPLDENAAFRGLFANRQNRVLLAEDNITNQQVALGMLTKMGLRADAVADGAEALEALKTIPYNLVLMDVRMPNMDGLEATRRIRSAELHHANGEWVPLRRLPVIAMTASAMQGDREKCIEAGMDDYIAKPVSPRVLAGVLEKWLPKGGSTQVGTGASLDSVPPAAVESNSIFAMAKLLARLMGDKKLVRTVLDSFLEDMPQQLLSLKQFIEEGSAQGIENQAHRINGASASVGGEAMQAVALEMEMAGKAGDLSSAKERLARLDAQFVHLKEAIAQQSAA